MKGTNLIILIAAGYAVWYFMQQKNKKTATAQGKNSLPLVRQQIMEAKADARDIANNIISQTEFVPDFSTDADMYKADQYNCR